MADQQYTVPSGSGANRPRVELRAAIRYQSTKQVSFFSTPKSEPLWARIRDISVAGIGLIISRGLEPGTALTIELNDQQLSASVIHARPDAAGTWLVGCQFDTKLTDAQLRSLL
jgi:hypothetical protein